MTNKEKILDLIKRHTIKVNSIEKINDKTIIGFRILK